MPAPIVAEPTTPILENSRATAMLLTLPVREFRTSYGQSGMSLLTPRTVHRFPMNRTVRSSIGIAVRLRAVRGEVDHRGDRVRAIAFGRTNSRSPSGP